MKKNILILMCSFFSLYCTSQETKLQKQTIANDTSTVLVPLRGVRSAGVRGCENCNVSGKLAQRLNLTSFTVDSLASFKYNEKLNTLEIKYLISNVKGKIKPGGIMVGSPFGGLNPHGGGSLCLQYGFSCPAPADRIGKTKYEAVKEGEKNYLVVTFLEDLRVEKGFFSEY
jgi:hypothetical protein